MRSLKCEQIPLVRAQRGFVARGEGARANEGRKTRSRVRRRLVEEGDEEMWCVMAKGGGRRRNATQRNAPEASLAPGGPPHLRMESQGAEGVALARRVQVVHRVVRGGTAANKPLGNKQTDESECRKAEKTRREETRRSVRVGCCHESSVEC